MAKKGVGKFIALASVAGAAAAGISYLTKYRSFHKELQKDFRDFEEEDDLFEDDEDVQPVKDRTYVSLNASKDEFLVAASDMVDAARGMAGAARDMIRDTIAIVTDTAEDAADLAADTVKSVREKAEEAQEDLREELRAETEEETAETEDDAAKEQEPEETKEETADVPETAGTATISEDV